MKSASDNRPGAPCRMNACPESIRLSDDFRGGVCYFSAAAAGRPPLQAFAKLPVQDPATRARAGPGGRAHRHGHGDVMVTGTRVGKFHHFAISVTRCTMVARKDGKREKTLKERLQVCPSTCYAEGAARALALRNQSVARDGMPQTSLAATQSHHLMMILASCPASAMMMRCCQTSLW